MSVLNFTMKILTARHKKLRFLFLYTSQIIKPIWLSSTFCFILFCSAEISYAKCTNLKIFKEDKYDSCRISYVDFSHDYGLHDLPEEDCGRFCVGIESSGNANENSSSTETSEDNLTKLRKSFLALLDAHLMDWPLDEKLKINTSNPHKLAEFEEFLGKKYQLIASKKDLNEIEASPRDVALHKAIQIGDGVLVEDTSLDIEGAKVGVDVRWMLENLSDYEGRAAQWTVLLAIKKGDYIRLCQGEVSGIIVKKAGEGHGFDPIFKPDGSDKTLAQKKNDEDNARYHAVQALLKNDPKHCSTTRIPANLQNWTGPWQHSD